MKPPRGWLVVAGVVALVVLIPGGAAVVAVKLITAARGRRDFLAQLGAEVARQLEELRPDLDAEQRRRVAAIVAAQGAVETGDGRTPAWIQGWNFGNVTAGSASLWPGPVVVAGDTEPDASGRYVPITARFRKYGSLAEAVSDFFRVLNWPRYRPAREALMRGDAGEYARRLRDDDPATVQVEGGYFTAPLADYQAGMANRLADALKALT